MTKAENPIQIYLQHDLSFLSISFVVFLPGFQKGRDIKASKRKRAGISRLLKEKGVVQGKT
jgi:hypothetical protein